MALNLKEIPEIKSLELKFEEESKSIRSPESSKTSSEVSAVISDKTQIVEVDKEKVYYIKMKVLPQTNLPADKGLFCVVNFVKANSANAYDDDTSQLCIEKQVTTVKTTPAAGPELGLILLAGNLLGVTTGLYLKKKLA